MILSAHQPQYLPGARLIAKIARADRFCYFDRVQYERRSFENRNLVKTADGVQWLTVPVRSAEHFTKTGGEIEIVHGSWVRKHCRAIELAYGKAEFFARYFDGLCNTLSAGHKTLGELNLALLRWFCAQLAVETPIVLASDHHFAGEKSALVLDMCKTLCATEYLFGEMGEGYADVAAFHAAGVTPRFQNYRQKPYRQLHGAFVYGMSALDILMNEGPQTLSIIRASDGYINGIAATLQS